MIEEKGISDGQAVENQESISDTKGILEENRADDTVTTNPEATETKNSVPKASASSKPRSAKKRKAKSRKTVTAKAAVPKRNAAPFPAVSFEEALTIANAIQKFASGEKVRRVTLFDNLDKSPDSGTSRQLVTNSGRYGLSTGGYQAEFLELTQIGKIASNPETSARERTRARFKLAIEGIDPFNAIYQRLKGNRLPTTSVIEDIAKENGVPEPFARECVDTFIVNARFLGLLKTMSGAERLVTIEHLLDELPATSSSQQAHYSPTPTGDTSPLSNSTSTNWDKTCFYISPIGESDSEHRHHADLFLGSIVEPALEEFGLNVVRADQIGKPGMITSQIIEHILRSKLVVADLSFHNPNVFYELALRHVCRLPTVQIIRVKDGIPFDLDQFRTIQIDTTDIYTLVPKLQTYKAEIATQVRAALANADSVDNPMSTYYPNLKVTFQ